MISEAPHSCGVLADHQVDCFSIASIPKQVTEIRKKMREFLRSSRFSEEELADVELAIGEACTNAVKHGSPLGESDKVHIKFVMENHALIVEVSDNGRGFRPEIVCSPTPELLNESGMGVFLMRALMDKVEFDFSLGTTVRLVKYCRQSHTEYHG